MSEKTLSSTPIYDGVVVKLRKDKILTQRGVESYREIVSHGGGACVLAVKDGKVLLERQFRYAYGEEIYELPAGKRDKGEDFYSTATNIAFYQLLQEKITLYSAAASYKAENLTKFTICGSETNTLDYPLLNGQ